MTILILVATIKNLLDLDKYALPWRSYCALSPVFPPLNVDLEALSQVGVFVGVMSVGTEAGFRRREMIRSTWAKQSGGMGRTVVKFVVGRGSESSIKELEIENELHGDIVILPIKENMNGGKTYAYFSWAHEHALVPSYSNQTRSNSTNGWVRPDYVVKTDDDSFVVLSELEARLRVEWYEASGEERGWGPLADENVDQGVDLVKDYFMAGELYALSWPLVSYVAGDERVKRMTIGSEDQQVAKWMNEHPQASRTLALSLPGSRLNLWDRYAHGFLYPSEVERVRKAIAGGRTGDELRKAGLPTSYLADSPMYSWSSVTGPSPRYRLLAGSKIGNLTAAMRVEALVEGSALSWAVSPRQPYDWERIQEAYDRRETRRERYMGKKLGGTVVVHYLKKDEWFLETAVALRGP
ncbi:hypothetical protein FRC10_010922 [Ceratobasidium sp. 414]|nr:hypothetical protein FRC10_010922 [Ceratobasidium sp. 414]